MVQKGPLLPEFGPAACPRSCTDVLACVLTWRLAEAWTSKKWAGHFATEDWAVILSVKSYYVHNDAPVLFSGKLEWQSFSHWQ